MTITRRQAMQIAAGLAATTCRAESLGPRPAKIIDTHAHFFDPKRPQGVPWPPKDDSLLYRTTLPKNYRELPVPQRVDGIVVVEASAWVDDNQWILGLAAREPLIIGLVGNLPLGTPECAGHLKRLAANPLFCGVRTRDGSFDKMLDDRAFVRDLRAVADRGLAFDVHSPPSWVAPALRLARLVPNLRLIINHVANAKVNGQPPPQPWQRLMTDLAAHPQVTMKVSGLVEGTGRLNGDAPRDVNTYRPVLEFLWKTFGPDRLLYGSNWPVSARFAPLDRVEQIALTFFAEKGQAALDKVFWQNAQTAYRVALRGG